MRCSRGVVRAKIQGWHETRGNLRKINLSKRQAQKVLLELKANLWESKSNAVQGNPTWEGF